MTPWGFLQLIWPREGGEQTIIVNNFGELAVEVDDQSVSAFVVDDAVAACVFDDSIQAVVVDDTIPALVSDGAIGATVQ